MTDAYTVDDTDNEGWYGKDLSGPDGWSCRLGEPEDCTWLRDGSDVVDRLNAQHRRIVALGSAAAAAADLLAILTAFEAKQVEWFVVRAAMDHMRASMVR
jgi:hypothetical protein